KPKQATLIISFIFLSFLFCANAAENIAVVLKVRGEVTVTEANSTEGKDVKKGYILQDGDKLETGPLSFCAIKFLDDKSLLRIKEKSTCVIEGKREQNAIEKNIFVEIGSFFTSLFKPKGKFKVTTPTSVASVKGTQFWILQLGQTGETRYICIEGIIEVENSAGKVLVKEGQTATVASRSRMPEVGLTKPGEIPSDEENQSSARTLDVEFTDPNGQNKILRIQIKE
ncbi:MAG: hypothetical protein GWN16_01315, partial [Calditrichae bacterium]|nr:hypothetical protein [Calditrichia bacterium]